MTLRNRFILITLGLVIFMIVGPILVLFSLGYKFDFSKNEVVKTGSLVVKSEPSRAQIWLDGKHLKDTAPATLRFLLPKDYDVTIKKDGYQSWTKRLSVRSELVTWANLDREFISLFLDQAKRTDTQDIQASFKSPKNDSVVTVKSGKVYLTDDEGHENEVNPVSWKLLDTHIAQLGNDSIFYILEANRSLNLNHELLLSIIKIETNRDYSVIQTADRMTINDSSNKLLYELPLVTDFTLEGSNLWIVQQGSLRRFDLRDGSSNLVMDSLPLAKPRIIRGNGNIFLLLDNALYIHNDKLEKIYDNVAYVYWDDSSKQLIHANDHEIFLFNPSGNRSELILRSTTKIDQPIVNSETGYVFFSNEGKIKAIEIDGRDHRNIYGIVEGKNFLVSPNGKHLEVFDEQNFLKYDIR